MFRVNDLLKHLNPVGVVETCRLVNHILCGRKSFDEVSTLVWLMFEIVSLCWLPCLLSWLCACVCWSEKLCIGFNMASAAVMMKSVYNEDWTGLDCFQSFAISVSLDFRCHFARAQLSPSLKHPSSLIFCILVTVKSLRSPPAAESLDLRLFKESKHIMFD